MILGVDIEYLLCIFDEPNHIGFIFESISHNNKIMMDYIKELENKFKQLEKQHMKLLMQWGKSDNPPLKLEELHRDMWVWDNSHKQYGWISTVTGKSLVIRFINRVTGYLSFEENRFYRNEVDEN